MLSVVPNGSPPKEGPQKVKMGRAEMIQPELYIFNFTTACLSAA